MSKAFSFAALEASTWPQGCKTVFMLNSTEPEISIAHKNEMLKDFLLSKLSDVLHVYKCWRFNIYEHDKFLDLFN